MINKNKITKLILFVLTFTILSSSCFTAFGASGKWIKSNNRWWYRHNDASYTTNDWEKIDKKWYRFDYKGWMQTGWKKVDNQWYYLNSNGDMAIGWKKVKGDWYYLRTNGAMQTGWKKINGTWYFFDKTGAMVKESFMHWKDQTYYLNRSGAMVTKWCKINDEWYYFDPSGAMCFNKWIDNYYVASDGKWRANTEITIDKMVESIDFMYYEDVPINSKFVSSDDSMFISQLTASMSNAKPTERIIEEIAGGCVCVITLNYYDNTSESFSVLVEENILCKNNIMYELEDEEIKDFFNTLFEE